MHSERSIKAILLHGGLIKSGEIRNILANGGDIGTEWTMEDMALLLEWFAALSQREFKTILPANVFTYFMQQVLRCIHSLIGKQVYTVAYRTVYKYTVYVIIQLYTCSIF